jgi:hypothetical protein
MAHVDMAGLSQSSSERLGSRRAMLLGALGAIGAWAAGALGNRGVVRAADGDPLILGQSNSASSLTQLSAPSPGTSDAVLKLVGSGTSGTGVLTEAGGNGLIGKGITGVLGRSTSINGSGVLGEELTESPLGRGVQGISHNGWGVYAVSPGGQALRVDGRATFSRSGLVVVPAGQSQVTVTGIPLSASSSFPERPSLVLALVQQQNTSVFVTAAKPDVAGSRITIELNRRARTPTTVAWFIVN